MSLRETLTEELARLEALAQELELKAHLAKADAKDELKVLWAKAEEQRVELERELERLKQGAAEPMADIGAAARQLAVEVRAGYEKMRALLRK
jgi:hypothetical protein